MSCRASMGTEATPSSLYSAVGWPESRRSMVLSMSAMDCLFRPWFSYNMKSFNPRKQASDSVDWNAPWLMML